ncbi:MAG: class I SAM-dependent methyltransferase [Thermoleophilaceae bacterium]
MTGEMERFWDERAREDAAYFVNNLLDYRRADMDRFWEGGERIVDRTLETLDIDIRADDEIAEIGCGLGRLTRVLAERARRVWAFDVSSEMLRQAQELLGDVENVDWIHGDGSSLAPLADGSVGACFSFVVFQHLPDPAITLDYVREMGRVLRPRGWSAFQISNDPSIHKPRGRDWRLTLKSLVGRAPRGQSHPAWLGSAVDLCELERTANEAGMDVERVEGAGTQFCLVLLRRR